MIESAKRGVQAATCAAALLLVAVADGSAALMEYLYVEPNAGVASGGHIGLRLGDRVYHYQNEGSGALRLARSQFDHFRYVYSVLQNRTIRVVRVELEEADWSRLHDRFEANYLFETRHFGLLDALLLDERLLGIIAGEAEGPLRLRGAGFFPASPRLAATDGADRVPTLARLRERLRSERGPDFLRERIEAVEARIRELSPRDGDGRLPEVSADVFPALPYTFSERFADYARERAALAAIEEARPLDDRWFVSGPGSALELSALEVDLLDALRQRLEDGVVSLLDSRRSDRGVAMLTSLARIAVLAESVRTGRFIVLDAFPERVATIRPGRGEHLAYIEELRGEAHRRLRTLREGLAEGRELDETAYSELEDATNRLVEFERGIREQRDVRVHGQHLVPEALGEIGTQLLPALAADIAALERDRAAERTQAYASSLSQAYGYQLLSHNCVTVVLATIDGTLGPEPLGGRVAANGLLHFIPRVSFQQAKKHWTAAQVGAIPSYRQTRVDELTAEEPRRLARLGLALREGNTLTSTSYRRNERDSFFLFFTDRAPLIRPIHGLANLAAGLAETTLGLLALPFDAGRRLESGALGTLFSLPELVFVNIRKGSFAYARGETPRTHFRPQR